MAKTIRLDRIRTDGGTQSREALDHDTLGDYAGVIADGGKFPPVVVLFDGEHYWLADGLHRYQAHQARNLEEIECEVIAGSRRDAVLYAAGANAEHGLRRTANDKRKAVTMLLEDEEWSRWSDREIARRCKVSQPFVGKVRKEITDNVISDHTSSSDGATRAYINKHGQEATMRTGNIGKSPRSLESLRVPVKLTYHPLCLCFPDMQEHEFSGLVEDIRQHGLHNPITLFDGMILDGRMRYLACLEAEVDPHFEEFEGDFESAAHFVWSRNVQHRAHFTEDQRAVIAARYQELSEQSED